MSEFRRFIIALAEVVAVLCIIVFTLGGGISGARYTQFGGYGLGGQDHAAFGFLVGALVGFVVSAMPAAFLFTLSEILANTQRALVLLQRGSAGGGLLAGRASGEPPQVESPVDKGQAR